MEREGQGPENGHQVNVIHPEIMHTLANQHKSEQFYIYNV